jgi:outer membrane biosynthesis protein TonB
LGLIGSIILHFAVFGFVIFNFMSRNEEPSAPPVPVSVEIMSPKDYSERQAGKTDGKANMQPTPPAEVKAPESTATAKKEVTEQKPTPKPAEKEAAVPPPAAPPAPQPPAPKPVEQAKVEPKPEPKPEKVVEKAAPPKKVVKKETPPPKPKPKAEATPEVKFDPKKIAAELQDQEKPKPSAAQSMEARASKFYTSQQTALLNRDPNAGAQAGDYTPGKPWRPASSLQDQAMGLANAHGAMNAGSCADAIQSRIEQAWILPIGGQSAESAVIRLHIELNRDGSLVRPPEVLSPAYTPVQQALADSAIRAAASAQPYNIPPQQYEMCRDITLKFNPRDMYGG